ncbi:MAG: polysaccharide biosynthesis/export family protein [Candidatus Deferrimicrobium sp.]
MVKAIRAVACSVLVVLIIAVPLVLPVFAQEATGIVAPRRNYPMPTDNSTPTRPPTLAAQGGIMDNSAKIRRPIQTPPGSQSDPSYRLGPEDQLRISVWDNKELTLDLVVRPDGKISMPLLQDVPAEGLTAAQLAANIQEGLSAYIVNPEVTVIVLQVNAPKYYIIGYVTRPGTYPLRGDTSVLQALALAGGLTQFASPRSIKLIRATRGRQEVRKINYYDLINDGGEGNYLLKSGDTIVVP